MKCNDLQFILPLYPDGVLTDKEQAVIEAHLDSCPVCRQKLADLHDIRGSLRAVSKPALAPGAIREIRAALTTGLAACAPGQMFQPIGDRRRWVDVWLMPFAVGSLSTVLLGLSLLWVMISNEVTPIAGRPPSNTTILYPYASSPAVPVASDLNPMEYASSRAAWSHESPSINPTGSLVALTTNLVDEIDDEELTVVADVYGNGSASITEVVEPSSDGRAIEELQKALGSESVASAFVPASYDQRIDPMRVVFKIQTVSVNTNLR